MTEKPKAASNEYKRAFRDANYDQIGLSVPKGEREVWRNYAAGRGMSLNKMIQEAVRQFIERDGQA